MDVRKPRLKYNRDKLRYRSDLTDNEWSHIEPIIPPWPARLFIAGYLSRAKRPQGRLCRGLARWKTFTTDCA